MILSRERPMARDLGVALLAWLGVVACLLPAPAARGQEVPKQLTFPSEASAITVDVGSSTTTGGRPGVSLGTSSPCARTAGCSPSWASRPATWTSPRRRPRRLHAACSRRSSRTTRVPGPRRVASWPCRSTTWGSRGVFEPGEGQRRKAESRLEGNGSGEAEEPIPPPPERAALRRRCGSEMRIVSFLTDPRVVRRSVDHLRKRDRPARPPPPRVPQTLASPA
jgi:hypothetical protein